MLPRIVSIQFSKAGKLYDFNALDFELHPGNSIIVETERGTSIGTVISEPAERSAETLPRNLASIIRIANADDFAIRDRILQKEKEAFDFCLKRIVERSMEMKLVKVEYQFDESKAVFFFTADGRVDFRDLVKDLAHTFHTRIEMRQIGVRDEAKMIGGIGICGRELCCCSFLREFQPVSVKMAKEQNLALNPNKISGQCGRLLCCLDYEYETYCSLRKSFPKCGKRVRTAAAVGTIDKINILTGDITLKLDDNKIIVVKRVEVLGEAAAAEARPAPEVKPGGARQEKYGKSAEQRDKNRPQRPQRPQRPHQHDQTTGGEGNKPAPPSSEPATAVAPATVATAIAPAAAAPEAQKTAGDETRPAKKRSRNRRHGHRKPGNKPQNPGDSSPT